MPPDRRFRRQPDHVIETPCDHRDERPGYVQAPASPLEGMPEREWGRLLAGGCGGESHGGSIPSPFATFWGVRLAASRLSLEQVIAGSSPAHPTQRMIVVAQEMRNLMDCPHRTYLGGDWHE